MGKGRRRSRQGSDGESDEVRPLDVDGVRTIGILTIAWAVAFVGLALRLTSLNAKGHGWWLWTCLAGVGLGLLGLEYTRKRRDAIKLAQEEDEDQPVDGIVESDDEQTDAGPSPATAGDQAGVDPSTMGDAPTVAPTLPSYHQLPPEPRSTPPTAAPATFAPRDTLGQPPRPSSPSIEPPRERPSSAAVTRPIEADVSRIEPSRGYPAGEPIADEAVTASSVLKPAQYPSSDEVQASTSSASTLGLTSEPVPNPSRPALADDDEPLLDASLGSVQRRRPDPATDDIDEIIRSEDGHHPGGSSRRSGRA